MQFFFLELIERLKNTARKGWVIRGVRDAESVADHMYRMAIMCLVAPEVRSMCLAFFSVEAEADTGPRPTKIHVCVLCRSLLSTTWERP